MKIKYKILTIVVCASVLFSLVCISSSAYGFSENRTDMPNLTNRDLIRLNDCYVTVYGDYGSKTLDLGLPRWALREYYGNGKVTVLNSRINEEEYLYYNYNIYYNVNGVYHDSSLRYTSNNITHTFNQLNGIDVYCKQYIKHNNVDSEYYDGIRIGIDREYISSANIIYDYFENGELKHYTFIADVHDVDNGVVIYYLPDGVDLTEDEVWYNLEVKISFTDTVNISQIELYSPYTSEDKLESLVANNLDFIKMNYNSAPWYADVWQMFADAVSALFSVKIFGSISIGYIAIIPLAIALFKLFLKVFSGG